jgi:hypothetical protein
VFASPALKLGAEITLQEQLMRLEPLYRIRFTYPESWAVSLDGGWQQASPHLRGHRPGQALPLSRPYRRVFALVSGISRYGR